MLFDCVRVSETGKSLCSSGMKTLQQHMFHLVDVDDRGDRDVIY